MKQRSPSLSGLVPELEIVQDIQEGKSQKPTGFASIAGILLMGLATIFLALMTTLLKVIYLHTSITIYEVTYFRGLSLCLFNVIYSKVIGVDVLQISPYVARELLYRVLFGICAISTYYLANKLLPISLAAALCFTDPILTAIIGWLFFKEKITRFDVIAMVLAFIGVLCILLNPLRTSNDSSPINILYMIVPLISAVACAFVYNFTRQLAQIVHWIVAPTYFGLGIACTLPIALLFNDSLNLDYTKYTPWLISMMFIMYIFGWLGQLLVSKSLQLEYAGRAIVLNYLQIVYLFIADMIVFNVKINYVDVLGTILIVGCNFTIALLKFFNIIL